MERVAMAIFDNVNKITDRIVIPALIVLNSNIKYS